MIISAVNLSLPSLTMDPWWIVLKNEVMHVKKNAGVKVNSEVAFFKKRLFYGNILMKLVIWPCTYLFDTT